MALPISQQTLEDAFNSANNLALAFKAEVSRLHDASLAGPTSRRDYVALLRKAAGCIAAWQAAAGLTGIVAYARDQYGNQTLDVVAEYTAMISAVTAIRDSVFSTFPTDAGTGAWLIEQYDQDGLPTSLTFTTAQLATFRTLAQGYLASVS